MQNENTSGLALLQVEMARQRSDAAQSLSVSRPIAGEIAASARRTGRLVLYGMGGSHHVNRSVECLYREMGIDTTALVASEALLAPLPHGTRTALFVSQSGRSGEIVECLGLAAPGEERFGLTLDAASPLGGTLPSLVGVGGPEVAFAATRSILVTLSLHAAVLEALGMPMDAFRSSLESSSPTVPEEIVTALATCDATVFVAQHALQGLAEGAALALMELARIPAFALEGGQFRHGPPEFLRPGIGVVLLRSAGPENSRIGALAEISTGAQAYTVVLDASGGAALPGATTVSVEASAGLAAVTNILFVIQNLAISIARKRVPDVGVPVRSTKVTL